VVLHSFHLGCLHPTISVGGVPQDARNAAAVAGAHKMVPLPPVSAGQPLAADKVHHLLLEHAWAAVVMMAGREHY